jgi:hypothetical protein
MLAEPCDGPSVGSMQNLHQIPQLQPMGMVYGVLSRTTWSEASLQKASAGAGSASLSLCITESDRF